MWVGSQPVLRPMHSVSRFPCCTGAGLVGADNRGGEHGLFVVGLLRPMFEHSLPSPAFRHLR
jgi:hypothetical protein